MSTVKTVRPSKARKPLARGEFIKIQNEKFGSSELEVLRNAMLFTFSSHAWGNRAQADKKLVSVNANKADLNVTKRLIRCEEYDAILRHINETYNWFLARSMMARLRKGFYFVKREVTDPKDPNKKISQIDLFDEYLTTQQAKLKELVEAFIKVYPAAKEAAKAPPIYFAEPEAKPEQTEAERIAALSARANKAWETRRLKKQGIETPKPERKSKKRETVGGGLGELYDERDYPTVEELSQMFYFEWNWLSLSVPDELPDEIRTRENAKLRKQYQDAQAEVKYALREAFAEMVKTATEQLTVKRGEKEKVFKQGAFDERWQNFFATFESKNILNDSDLAALVERTKTFLSGTSGQEMKDDSSIRDRVAAEFTKVKSEVAKLVVDKPVRRFALDD